MFHSRLEKLEQQNDFLENVAEKVRNGDIAQAEMEAHSWNMAYVYSCLLAVRRV